MEDLDFWKPPCDRDGDDHLQQEDRESVDAFGYTHQLTSAVSICPDAVARVSLMPFIRPI